MSEEQVSSATRPSASCTRRQPADADPLARRPPPCIQAAARRCVLPLREWRCPLCGKLLAKVGVRTGSHVTFETRCPRCGAAVTREETA